MGLFPDEEGFIHPPRNYTAKDSSATANSTALTTPERWLVIYKGPFIYYVRTPRERGGVGKISTYSYFGGGRVKPILT